MILETPRLQLHALTFDDAPFILALVNEPSWLEHIGDRNVHSLEDAKRYLREGPMAMYDRHGFGLYRVVRREDGASIGMCGLVQREGMEYADIGYALLPAFCGQGYAIEAAQAMLAYGNTVLGLMPIAAITTQANQRSVALLQRLGLQYLRDIQLPQIEKTLSLYQQPLPA